MSEWLCSQKETSSNLRKLLISDVKISTLILLKVYSSQMIELMAFVEYN